MRIVATEYISLDGVFEEPGHWSGPFFNEQAANFKWAELQASDALLLGRRTYEGFAAAWPTFTDEAGFADKMNSMPKYVVSSTLDTVEWSGSSLIGGDPLKQVRTLKQQPGQDLLLAGSRQLFTALHQAELIDLYRLMLHPVILGSGERLFPEVPNVAAGLDSTALKLTGSQTFDSGVVILEYQLAPQS